MALCSPHPGLRSAKRPLQPHPRFSAVPEHLVGMAVNTPLQVWGYGLARNLSESLQEESRRCLHFGPCPGLALAGAWHAGRRELVCRHPSAFSSIIPRPTPGGCNDSENPHLAGEEPDAQKADWPRSCSLSGQSPAGGETRVLEAWWLQWDPGPQCPRLAGALARHF